MSLHARSLQTVKTTRKSQEISCSITITIQNSIQFGSVPFALAWRCKRCEPVARVAYRLASNARQSVLWFTVHYCPIPRFRSVCPLQYAIAAKGQSESSMDLKCRPQAYRFYLKPFYEFYLGFK